MFFWFLLSRDQKSIFLQFQWVLAFFLLKPFLQMFFLFFFFLFLFFSVLPFPTFISSLSLLLYQSLSHAIIFCSFSICLSSFASFFLAFFLFAFVRPNPFLKPLLFETHVAVLFCCFVIISCLLIVLVEQKLTLFWSTFRIATKRCSIRKPCL